MTHLLLPTRTFIQVFVDQKILEQAGSLSGRIRVYLKKQSFTKNNVLKKTTETSADGPRTTVWKPLIIGRCEGL